MRCVNTEPEVPKCEVSTRAVFCPSHKLETVSAVHCLSHTAINAEIECPRVFIVGEKFNVHVHRARKLGYSDEMFAFTILQHIVKQLHVLAENNCISRTSVDLLREIASF